jgi:hypothetical protein
VLCQAVLAAFSVPVTGSSLVVFTVTAVTLPPSSAVTVMPLAGLAFLLPGAGVIVRIFATVVAGWLATALGLSCVAAGVPLWHAVMSRAAAAARAIAMSRRVWSGLVRW